jgi:hypothetical protein
MEPVAHPGRLARPATGAAARVSTPRDLASTLREQVRNARRRYQAAVATALETLRFAEQHFGEASSAIDTHIQLARAAAAGDRGTMAKCA